MTKERYKAIVAGSRLRNKFHKYKTLESRDSYKRNYRVFHKSRSFYENHDPDLTTDNRTLWKQVNPFFSDKTPFNNNITLFEGNEIITDNTSFAEILNNFFSKSVDNLEINLNLYAHIEVNFIAPIDNIIEKFKYHPSINQKGFISLYEHK